MRADARVFRALLRSDFPFFLHRAFKQLDGGAELHFGWHLRVLCHVLEEVRLGRITRLIINLPPRHLKSISASVAFPAFCLGLDPSMRFICVSYGQELANKHSRDFQRVVLSDWYRSAFGKILGGKQSVEEFETIGGGSRLATSVGGVLTGRGADIIIIDDPQKPNDTLSDAQRYVTNNWFDNTLFSRLNDKKNGAIIIVMQRLHEDDLTGRVLEREGWTCLRFPAIAEADEMFEVATLRGPQTFRRRVGEALDPVREPLSVLETIRQTIGDYNFAGQYQQSPVPASGGMVKRAWFRTYRPAELPQYLEIVQSWDTASKVGELNDYSVCTTWGIAGNKAYLIHVHRARHEYPSLKRAVREQQQIHRASVVLIEDKSSGIQLAQELIHEGLYAVQRYRSQLGKTERMHAQTAMIENGLVLVPESEPWLDAYLDELTLFPHGKHDDQVDSTSQFLEWLKQRSMTPRAMFGSYGSPF
ncbi:phage terminase large subunit [Enterovirga rhinocerotis]|uniref:Putative phage terminase large subunit-like protein n=1 Tax=Enterovirga rhinocerotis TaxID=1339210 RepID=A0A4R7BMZ3_9HYPH|nr:phage terminase large subunit [Enterovirga rhinocerotis]TDR85287.1 putative phage terminase large subunit-like protein [Enterovirga rhinocerotis]